MTVPQPVGVSSPPPTHGYMLPSSPSFKYITELDGSWADPNHLADDELYEELIGCGIPLLHAAECVARGYSHGNPIALLTRMLCVAACDAPKVSILTGIGRRPLPLNLMVCMVGESGLGKGLTMDADISTAGMAGYRTATPASGEALIQAFFEQQPAADGKGTETVRHEEPVWANWGEIDQLAAKSGNVNSTLDATLRSLWTGERAGDESISRLKAGFGTIVEAGTYRFVMVVGAQPDHAGVLLKDTTGGTLQRLLWVTVRDDDAPATRAEAAVYRRRLETFLGLPPMSGEHTPPTLAVWGPNQGVTLADEVADIVWEAKQSVLRGETRVGRLNTHENNLRIRVAAIFAGWRAGKGRPAVIDRDAWWWAGCLLAASRRTREWCEGAAESKSRQEAGDAGKRDADRIMGRDCALEEAETAAIRSLYLRIRTRLETVRCEPRSVTQNVLTNGRNRKYFERAAQMVIVEGDMREVMKGRARVYEYTGKH